MLAPVVLFVYNRPWHTLQTLEAIAINELANQSHLIIYADGPKKTATHEDNNKIAKVREIIRKKKWSKSVEIIESKINKGLANSIIDGVTACFNKYDKIIVLEDDIVPSKGFLTYMNDALSMYDNDTNVGCIHAWNYNLKSSIFQKNTFFLKGADCWGWATWKRAWDLFNPNGKIVLEKIIQNNQQYSFNRNGTHEFIQMLEDQIEGKNDSWAIRWHASLFIQDMYCLHPTKTIVKNIGLDNSGIHCNNLDYIQNPINYIRLIKIKIEESTWFFHSFSKFVKSNNNQKKFSIWVKLKMSSKHLLHQ